MSASTVTARIIITRPALKGGEFNALRKRLFSSSPALLDQKSCEILVVGGGTGGSAIANKFGSKHKVIVVEPSDVHYYQPMFTLVGGGQKTFQQTSRSTRDVLGSSCELIKDKAVKFDPVKCVIETSKGDQIKYQYLVLSLGLQLDYHKIKGLEEALAKDPSVCSNYSPKYVTKTWPALQNFTDGNAIFTFPNSPVKCAGAPQKICYLAEDYFAKHGKRDKATVMYNTSLPAIFGIPKYAKALDKIASDRNIKVNKRMNLTEVDYQKKMATFESLDEPGKTQTFQYSFLHAVPPMSSPAVLCGTPLVDPSNFVSVNKDTLQHTAYQNVFALGDCSNAPTSKTAAAVAAQVGVIGTNLSQVIQGKQPTAKYNGYTSCPLTIRHNQVMLAEFGYDGSILETFPLDQSKPRYSMYYMKAYFMPFLYWKMLVKGMWHGPGLIRKLMRLGMTS